MGNRKHTARRSSPQGRNRRISVRGIRREPPNLQKFGAAIVALVLAQAEAEAEAASHSPAPAADQAEASSTQDGADG
jgi:hypothetical protein